MSQNLAPKPSIKILVGYHKPATLIKDDVYVPIQLGRAIESEPAFDGQLSEEDIAWLHENMIGDDTGENISKENRKCSELTGMYWAWKNYDKLGNPDYIGFMHYRRHFVFKDREKDILGADIVLPKLEKLPLTLYEHYRQEHHIEDLDLALEIIKQDFPEYAPYIPKLFTEQKALLCNMFVMKKAIFFEYMEWLFAIIAKVDLQTDYEKYSYYNHRMWGFLSERIFILFIEKKNKEHKSILHVAIQVKDNTDIPREVKPTFQKNNIPVVFSSDDNYAPYLGVAICSLIMNSSLEHNYDIFVLDGGISLPHKKRLKAMEQENISIRFIDIDPYLRGIDKSIFYLCSHPTLATYFRFFIPQIFKSFQKVIYLDCDMVIETDISKLYHIDIGDNLLGAVEDIGIMYINYHNFGIDKYLQNILGLCDGEPYFQAGTLIYNISLMLKENITEKCIITLAKIQKPRMPDQCILNAVCKKKVYFLDWDWNVMWHIPMVDKGFEKKLSIKNYKKYMNSREYPNIIHFSHSIKPWKNPEYEMADRFWKYATEGWREEILLTMQKKSKKNKTLRKKLKFFYVNNIQKK